MHISRKRGVGIKLCNMSAPEQLFDRLIELKNSARHPPVHRWQPERVGQIDIHIDANGVWFHEQRRFQRQALVDLFATILRREDNNYYLVTPAEKLLIEVADAPFIAIDMEVQGADQETDLLFTTNVGDYVLADAAHPLCMRDGQPYLHVRRGLEAKLTRSVYYRLVAVGLAEGDTLAVYSQGTRFALGDIS